jgi:hypothetical protein
MEAFSGDRWDVRLDFVRQLKSKKSCSKTLKSWDVRLGLSLTRSSNCRKKYYSNLIHGQNYVRIRLSSTKYNPVQSN